MSAGPRPELSWTDLPADWVSRGAAGMRAANFTIPHASGKTADLAVIPLPGTGGTDLDLVNLWRGQLALPPITPAELASHTVEAQIRGQPVKLFNIVGKESSDAAAASQQILVAAIRNEGFTWFFKLAGPAEVVAASEEPLKTFLAGVSFSTPPEAAEAGGTPVARSSASPAAETASGSAPSGQWDTPAAWASVPPTSMVYRKWVVAEGTAKAEITISQFPGETGGLVMNLNRWRGQVGLQPAPDQELTAMADNFDVLGGKGTLVDFSGPGNEGDPLRMIGAIVKRDGWSWFYKLVGPPALVEAQREAFVKFVQTARYTRGA